MGRGKVLRSVLDYMKEPYSKIIDLYLDIGNEALKLFELRYLLLEDHGVKTISQRTTKAAEMIGRILEFREKKRSLERIRDQLLKEGRMLVRTTGPNKGQPTDTNGLNKLIQTMKSDSRFKILEKIGDRYRLAMDAFSQLLRLDREKRIRECPYDMVCELRHGLTIYNLSTNKRMRKKLMRVNELYARVRDIQEEVLKVWAKRKISLFIGKLRSLTSLHDNGDFLGHCCEMVRWFVGSLGLDEKEFEDDFKRIEEIAKDDRTKETARTYLDEVNVCKEVLKETRLKFIVSYSETELWEHGQLTDEVETSSLSVPSTYSVLKGMKVSDVIQEMVRNGEMGKKTGELLLLQERMSELYRKRGLHKLLSSELFDEEPIIVLDTRLAH